MENKPNTYMVWQNNDPDKSVTDVMIVGWAVKRFEQKYGGPVSHVDCSNKIDLDNLQKAYPNIIFGHDPMIYHASIYNIYGKMQNDADSIEWKMQVEL